MQTWAPPSCAPVSYADGSQNGERRETRGSPEFRSKDERGDARAIGDALRPRRDRSRFFNGDEALIQDTAYCALRSVLLALTSALIRC